MPTAILNPNPPSNTKPVINIGIEEPDHQAIADGPSRLLADTYTLYLQTHNFHWNVTGARCFRLFTPCSRRATPRWQSWSTTSQSVSVHSEWPRPGTYDDFIRLASIEEVPVAIGAKRRGTIERNEISARRASEEAKAY